MSIRSEIESKLYAWAKSQAPPIPVAFENVAFSKPLTGAWLEIFFLNSVITNPTVDAERETERGIFQINCCTPQGVGLKDMSTLVASVSQLFPVVPKAGTVSIERPPQQARAIVRSDGFLVTPISVSYRQER